MESGARDSILPCLGSILTLASAGCVSWGNLLSLSGLQFPHLQNHQCSTRGKKKKKTALGLSKQRINADQGCFSKAGDDEVA